MTAVFVLLVILVGQQLMIPVKIILEEKIQTPHFAVEVQLVFAAMLPGQILPECVIAGHLLILNLIRRAITIPVPCVIYPHHLLNVRLTVYVAPLLCRRVRQMVWIPAVR